MKVLIVNNMVPFVWGGAEELAHHLRKNLIITGHEAEILRIPFKWEPAISIPSQMLMVRAFELYNVDHVIALKFPAYLIRHANKTFWLLHQYRQAYDLYDLDPGSSSINEELRILIKNADNKSIAESKHIFTNSEMTRRRLLHYNGYDSTVLYPPINDGELFNNEKMENYIFAGGRINSMKRQYLLIEALSQTKRVKLVIAGPPDSHADGEKLKEMVEKFGLIDRVKLDLRFLPREIYAKYMNESTAVAYIPYDEDSMGYVTMEAAVAGKAIITATDSGGTLGLVKEGETGWVVEPSASALAQAMESASENKFRTQEIGSAAKALWLKLGINWPQTVETLLQ